MVEALHMLRRGEVPQRADNFFKPLARNLEAGQVLPTKLFSTNRCVGRTHTCTHARVCASSHSLCVPAVCWLSEVTVCNDTEMARLPEPEAVYQAEDSTHVDPESPFSVDDCEREVGVCVGVGARLGCEGGNSHRCSVCHTQLKRLDFWRSCLATQFVRLKVGAQVRTCARSTAVGSKRLKACVAARLDSRCCC